eukprot:scaffold273796_cov31-Tisochrysis_lutea.AAC.9
MVVLAHSSSPAGEQRPASAVLVATGTVNTEGHRQEAAVPAPAARWASAPAARWVMAAGSFAAQPVRVTIPLLVPLLVPVLGADPLVLGLVPARLHELVAAQHQCAPVSAHSVHASAAADVAGTVLAAVVATPGLR